MNVSYFEKKSIQNEIKGLLKKVVKFKHLHVYELPKIC